MNILINRIILNVTVNSLTSNTAAIILFEMLYNIFFKFVSLGGVTERDLYAKALSVFKEFDTS
jgi:hypothetical protein